MSETESTVLGQSWAHGTVSLSWASTRQVLRIVTMDAMW